MNGKVLLGVTSHLPIIEFEFCGNQYSYITASDFLDMDLGCPKTVKKSKILNIGCAFDIETYKVGEYTTMYVWQLALDDITVIGRTWSEFKRVLTKLSIAYETSADRQLLCLVHNLSYEWSFIKCHFAWEKVFAIEERKVITANWNGIQFRDTLALTNKKLEKVAKDYDTGLDKLTEVYNYDLPMSQLTPLKLCQLAYCINDVQILSRFFRNHLKPTYLDKGYKIPLTMTGIVRDDLKRHFKSTLSKKEKDDWKRKIYRGYPTEKEYSLVMRWVYRGGYVHANATYSGDLITDPMGSMDFKSSYPAVMLHNKFPLRFIKKDKRYFYYIRNKRKWMKEHAFYGTFTFYRIKAKTAHTIESSNKILVQEKAKFDNGRLSRAEKVTVCLTEQDWLIYQRFYEWDLCICEGFRISKKEPLPHWMKDLILKYYFKKSTLPKDTVDYMLSKMQLNALYGMFCTGLYDTSLEWDNDIHQFEEVSKNKTYEDLIKGQILTPWVGIWVTAYARYNILSLMHKVGSYDAIYGDTDSIKYRGILRNQYIFDAYNDKMERANKNMYVGEYDRSIFKDLGKMDYEGKSYRFMANGAKRYIHTDLIYKDGKAKLKTVCTIAGLPKGTLQEKARQEKKSVYDLFVDDMTLSELESGKMTSKYIDAPFEVSYTDYQGRDVTQSEQSCVTLVHIPFKMSITDDYLQYREMEKKRNKMIIGRRTL